VPVATRPEWLSRMLMALAALFVNACSLSFGDAPSPVNVAVDAHEGWQDSGVSLAIGDDITIEYVEGQWTNWLGSVPFHGPDGGLSYVCSSSGCVEPLPGFPQGGLIGRIGFAEPLGVGDYAAFTADRDGMLQLRMNDAGTYDNKGSVLMRVTLDQSVECGIWLDMGGLNPGVSLGFRAGCV